MKKSVVFFVCLCFVFFNAIGQMQGSNLPRFIRWENNNQFVLNTKLNGDKTAKEYTYDVNTKKYTATTKVSTDNEITVFIKNANVYYPT